MAGLRMNAKKAASIDDLAIGSAGLPPLTDQALWWIGCSRDEFSRRAHEQEARLKQEGARWSGIGTYGPEEPVRRKLEREG